MIFLFTDFGCDGPYVGQMHAALKRAAPAVPVIDLFHDAPMFNPKAASYLLPAYTQQCQRGDVVVAVVDPGVGSARACVAVEADGVIYVGPDNGVFVHLIRRAAHVRAWSIAVPPTASASFHGRDVFAPVAARFALVEHQPSLTRLEDIGRLAHFSWPDDLAEIIYVDHYGNALTGLRVNTLNPGAVLVVGGQNVARARTFSDVTPGTAFYYGNSSGLIEIAVSGGKAAEILELRVGTPVAPRF